MAGTFFDGDSGVGFGWAGQNNASPSYYTTTATSVPAGTVGDLIAGSWSVQESATPIDILDTNGSVGGVSAAFKRNAQTVANTPGTTPVASSAYLQNQPCTFKHDLGTISGYITSVSPQGGQTTIDQSTPLSMLNVNMTMPPYVEGSYFYSWTPKTAAGVRIDYNAMDVMADGNLILTGATPGPNATAVYDRFGNFLWGINHASRGYGVAVDSLGTIYILHDTWVERFNADGTGATTFIASAGYGIRKIAVSNIAGAGNVAVATMDTAAASAIKIYNSSGTLINTSGTYSPSTIPPGPTTYANYTGMAYDGNSGIYVGNAVQNGTGGLLFYYNKIDPATGVTVGPYYAGRQYYEWGGLGMAVSAPSRITMFSQSGVYDSNGHYVNSVLKTTGFPDIGPSYGLPDAYPSVAIDEPYGGMFLMSNSTIYRLAHGQMGINQAIECYLGAAGYRGTITYGANSPYHQTDSNGTYAIAIPGWTGNVWSKLKELCARGKRQITTTGTGIRIIRTDQRNDMLKLDISNREAPPQVTEDQPGAQVINVTTQNVTLPNYNYGLLYTSGPQDSLLTVDVSGYSTTTLQLGVHAASVDQPVPINPFVISPATITDGPPNYNPIQYSAYTIADSSNPPLQVDANLWKKYGGSLSYRVNPDTPGAIDVSLTGPNNIVGYTGPFSVGFVVGSQKYSYFTISGYGICVNPATFQVYTSAKLPVTSEIESQNLDSVFIDTYAAGYDMARISATALSGGQLSLKVKIPITSLPTGTGFGQIAGSYFYWNRNNWRVTDATISAGWVDITAVRDTRVLDVQDGSISHAAIDNTWAGFRYLDNYLSPGILGA